MKIAFVSQPEYFSFIYEKGLEFLGEVKEFTFNYSKSDKDFESLEKYDPDIAFFFRGEYFPENVLSTLKGIKVNLSSEPFPNIIDDKINYTLDSLQRYKDFRKRIIKKSFDYVFHYDSSSLEFIRNDNINLSGEFYLPVALDTYKKIDLPQKWDFFFIGRSTPYREKHFSHLKHHYHFLHICHGIWGKDLVEYSNQSKILLNIHAEKEISWEPRMQMLMATGNMVISEKLPPNPYLIPGKDYIEISNPEELAAKAKYYLEHDKEREIIAANGLKKIQDLFDAKKNIPELIEKIKDGKYEKFTSGTSKSSLLGLTIIGIVKRVGFYAKDLLRELL